MPLLVRRIRPVDATLLRDVRLAALLDSPSAFSSTHAREAAFDDAEWQQRATLASGGDERATFLALADDRPVGMCGGFRSETTPSSIELVAMWTAPDHRRTGAGSLLVQAVVDFAVASGAATVDLWVMRGNEPAQQLYASMGFETVRDHQAPATDPCRDEVRMTRALDR